MNIFVNFEGNDNGENANAEVEMEHGANVEGENNSHNNGDFLQ